MTKAPIRKLQELSKKAPTPEYQAEYVAQVSTEKNDRGAVLLIGSNLENMLESAIGRFLFYDRVSKLFGQDKPLGSFRNKILIGYAMNLYGNDTFNNLEVVREIRNAFAHAKIPISFATPEVGAVCDLLNVVSLMEAHYKMEIPIGPAPLRGLDRFKHACHWMSSRLFQLWIDGPVNLDRDALKVPPPSGHECIVALPKPLP
jgi:hypothetical protein